MERLLLIRHAAAEGDGTSYSGRSDPPLSEHGRRQAEALQLPVHDRLTIRSSPLRRARQTAEIAFRGRPLEIEPLAVEISFGVLDGLTVVEAERLFPEAVARLRRYPTETATAGGESWESVLERACWLREKLVGARGLQVVVSHQYFLIGLVTVLCGGASGSPAPPALAPAQFVLLTRAAPGGRWKLAVGAAP